MTSRRPKRARKPTRHFEPAPAAARARLATARAATTVPRAPPQPRYHVTCPTSDSMKRWTLRKLKDAARVEGFESAWQEVDDGDRGTLLAALQRHAERNVWRFAKRLWTCCGLNNVEERGVQSIAFMAGDALWDAATAVFCKPKRVGDSAHALFFTKLSQNHN